MERTELILTHDFCRHYCVSYTFITSLQEAGLVNVVTIENEQYLHHDELRELEKLVRFHLDMDINVEGIEAIANLLQQVACLQKELAVARQRLGIYE